MADSDVTVLKVNVSQIPEETMYGISTFTRG